MNSIHQMIAILVKRKASFTERARMVAGAGEEKRAATLEGSADGVDVAISVLKAAADISNRVFRNYLAAELYAAAEDQKLRQEPGRALIVEWLSLTDAERAPWLAAADRALAIFVGTPKDGTGKAPPKGGA